MPLTTRTVAYADQDTALTGELYRDTGGAPRQGILLIHGGAGLDDHARRQASRYAALGYVVFACDMLGDGVAGDRARVIDSLTAMRDDPGLLARRARAALAELAGCGLATEPFAAVGFCFGGLAALTLARSGAGLAAAVSIHGSLATTRPAGPGALKARVLACHGALDPHVPMADVTGFAEEMDHGTITWTRAAITVTLDRPGAPRVARALALLIEQINATPPAMPGDPRPVTYHLAPAARHLTPGAAQFPEIWDLRTAHRTKAAQRTPLPLFPLLSVMGCRVSVPS